MPTCKTAEQRGYTLLEVLMVLFIIGLSLGAVLSTGLVAPARDQAARLEGFDREYRAMAQSAVLEGRTFGLDFVVCADTVLCWRWLEQQGARWKPVDEWPAELDSRGAEGFADSTFELRIEGLSHIPERATTAPDVMGKPEVYLYPTRETTAFSLRLRDSAGDEGLWHVDAMGRSGSHAAPQPPV